MIPTDDDPVRLVCGDALEVLRGLPDGCVDAVVTDPPFGVNLKTKTSDYRQSPNFDRGESLRASVVYDDDPDTIAALIREVMPEVLRVSKRAVIFCGPAMMHAYPEPDAMGCVYIPNGAGRCKWGFQCFQPILYYGKDPYLQRGMGGRPNSFRTEQPNREKIDHPCPKPLEWMVWAVRRVAFPGDFILDPFGGSGTTGVAAIQVGCRCLLVEQKPAYVAVAEKRINEALGVGSLFVPKAPAVASLFDSVTYTENVGQVAERL